MDIIGFDFKSYLCRMSQIMHVLTQQPQDPVALLEIEDPGPIESDLETSSQRGQGVHGSGEAQVAARANLQRGSFSKASGPCL